MADDVITIPMSEYKELLMTKGKYEELKSRDVSPGYLIRETEPIPRKWAEITC